MDWILAISVGCMVIFTAMVAYSCGFSNGYRKAQREAQRTEQAEGGK